MAGISRQEKDLGKFADGINAAFNGRSNAIGKVTLAAGAVTTVVSAVNCAPQSAVFLFAKSANAALAISNSPGVYVSSVGKQTFTLTHANNAQTDRDFFFVCLG